MADGGEAGTRDEAHVTTTDDAYLQWLKLPAMTSLYDESEDFTGGGDLSANGSLARYMFKRRSVGNLVD